MRVLYFGDPQGGLALLARGVPIVGVVHGRRGGAGWLRFVRAVKDLPRWLLPDLDDARIVASLADLRPSLIVSGFFPRLIPQAVLDLAPGVNVHPSDLPRWRGPDPTHWAIRAGDAHTAICVHQLTAELDAGAILLREAVPIQPRESAGRLSQRLEAHGAELLADVVARMAAGEVIPPQPQTGDITWAPMVDPDEVEIDWTRSGAEIDRLVRASAPWPGAYTGIGDELLVVYQGRVVPAARFATLPVGTPFVRQDRLLIRCGGDDAYRLDRVRLGRRRLTGAELARLFV
jgi:methionyl-tRNA formyltransferase